MLLVAVSAEEWNVSQTPKITFLQAIARMEGFDKRGSRPQRNNNPGDIEFGKFATAHGATKAEQPLGRFAVFPDAATGFAAMKALFEAPSYASDSVYQAIARWAPPPENDVQDYVDSVCKMVGCLQTDKVSDLIQV